MCILNICHSHILKRSFFNKKQRKQKKIKQKLISNAVFESRKRTRFLVIEKTKFEAQFQHLRFMAPK